MMLKIKNVLCILLCAVCLFCSGCVTKDAKCTIIIDEPTVFAFTVEEVKGNATVFDAMKSLAGENKLSFKIENGMVIAINSKNNQQGSYWILYTTDAELGSSAFGTYQYEGTQLLSAVLGCELLILKNGHTYLWAYVQL